MKRYAVIAKPEKEPSIITITGGAFAYEDKTVKLIRRCINHLSGLRTFDHGPGSLVWFNKFFIIPFAAVDNLSLLKNCARLEIKVSPPFHF